MPRPTRREDVGGADAAAKLAILASLAFHRHLHIDDVPFEGIDTLHDDDVAFANELGYAVKLLAHARLSARASPPASAPCWCRTSTRWRASAAASTPSCCAASEIREIMLQGPGAGGAETATAVIGDLLSVLGPRPEGESRHGLPRAAARAREQRAQPALRASRGHRPAGRAGPHRRALRRSRHLARRHDPAAAPRRPRLARVPHPPGLGGERHAPRWTRSQRSTSATASRASCACSPRERDPRACFRAATGAGCSPHSCSTRSARASDWWRCPGSCSTPAATPRPPGWWPSSASSRTCSSASSRA